MSEAAVIIDLMMKDVSNIVLLHLDDNLSSFVVGFMTSGFQLKDIQGPCAVNSKGLVYPNINKTYKVKIGDPSVFTATYKGTTPLYLKELLYSNCDITEFGIYPLCSKYCVFQQGTEYLVYKKTFTEIHKKKSLLRRLLGL
jgi:hypothetical protein